MADQIYTRFGALTHRLAAAVRHALDTAVTDTALAPMNAVHLRMALIAEILDSEPPPPEPPSHRWYEFMVECFGRNLRPSDSRSNSTALVHVDFAESYVTNEAEDRIIQDLLVAAGVFLVAESTAMDEQIEQWNITGRNDFVSEELCAIAGRAGAVGFDLLKHAEARTWRELLSTITPEPDAPITNTEQTHARSAPTAALPRANYSRVGGRSDTENPDYVVLMVDSVEANHRPALTAQALAKLRETASSYSELSPKDSVVVVSAADGSQPTSLPLTSQRLNTSPEEDSSNKRLIEHTLNQVAQLVEVLSQPAGRVSTIAMSSTRPLGEQRDLIAGIHSVTRIYDPVILIILSNEYNSIAPFDLRSELGPGPSLNKYVETLRDHDRLPDLRRVSVIFLCPAPSSTHVDAYWPAICTAAGALSCEFYFTAPKRELISTSPAGGPFRTENASPAPPAPPVPSIPISGSVKSGSRKSPVRAGHGSPAIGESRVRLCNDGPVTASVDDEDSAPPADPPERVANGVELPPVGGLLSYICANKHRIWRPLIPAAPAVIGIIGIFAMRVMTNTTLFLVVPGVMVLLYVCVLIGSGLNTRSIERHCRYRAQLVRQRNERERTAMDARDYSIPPRSAGGLSAGD